MNKVDILGIGFHSVTLAELNEKLEEIIEQDRKIALAFSNPEFVITSKDSEFLGSYLNQVEYNLADGIGVVWASKLFGKGLPERITGTDFTQEMAELSSMNGYSIYLLGGKPGIADRAKKNMEKEHPGCRIVGCRNGYFRKDDEGRILEEIAAVKPDFLMVCLGNPKQEAWISRNFDNLKAKVIFGNGGALDFAAGEVKRAPLIMQKLGLEWLWRMFQDLTFKRLKRQVKLPVFAFRVLIEFVLRIVVRGK